MIESPPAPEASDAHEIHVNALLERAGITRDALRKHVRAGFLPPGAKRVGVAGLFWTKREANLYLKRRGLRDKQFD